MRLISSRVRWPQRIVHGEREADRIPRRLIQAVAICVFCVYRLFHLR